MKKLSLIIPCYNEAKSLEALTSRAIQCATKRNLTPEQFELVVVDNGSSDGSDAVIDALIKGPNKRFLHPVRVEKNQGYGFGVYSGLRAATGGTLAWTHADEQCDPEDVFVAWEIQRAKGEKCLVKGRRYERALGDMLFSRGFELVALGLLSQYVHEINAQPKVFDAALMKTATNPPYGFPFDLYMLLKAKEAGFHIESIPVRFPPRRHGESRWASTFRSKFRTIAGMVRFMWDYRAGKSPGHLVSGQGQSAAPKTTRERNVS